MLKAECNSTPPGVRSLLVSVNAVSYQGNVSKQGEEKKCFIVLKLLDETIMGTKRPQINV